MNVKYLRVFSSIFILVAYLSGCASISIPSQEQAETVLVIPKQTSSSTFEEWVWKFSIEISQSGKIVKAVSVPASSQNFIVIDDLPAGTYRIEKYLGYIASRKWRPTGDTIRERVYEISPIEFELTSNQLTVLTSEFIAEQSNKGGFIYTHAFFKPMLPAEHKRIVEKINGIDQYNWPVTMPW